MSSRDGTPIQDSTDWLATSLPGFARLEAALRCEVCKDFYQTPMITSCSHTFCSLCIRRALSRDGHCPLCRASEQEIRLRPNWSISEVVESFVHCRPTALELSRAAPPNESQPKRKHVAANDDADGFPAETKRLRSSSRIQSCTQRSVQIEHHAVGTTEGADDLVSCPGCQRPMKQWQVFSHLDQCPGPTALISDPGLSVAELCTRHSVPPPAGSGRPSDRERLPAINYAMLKDNALRKKMSDLGISTSGPRTLLERRHREWLAIWNANCDAAYPRKRSELIHALETWEKTQGGRLAWANPSAPSTVAVRDKNFDTALWAADHKGSFHDLIAQARQSRKQAVSEGGDDARPDQAEEEEGSGSALGLQEDRPDEAAAAGEPPSLPRGDDGETEVDAFVDSEESGTHAASGDTGPKDDAGLRNTSTPCTSVAQSTEQSLLEQ